MARHQLTAFFAFLLQSAKNSRVWSSILICHKETEAYNILSLKGKLQQNLVANYLVEKYKAKPTL